MVLIGIFASSHEALSCGPEFGTANGPIRGNRKGRRKQGDYGRLDLRLKPNLFLLSHFLIKFSSIFLQDQLIAQAIELLEGELRHLLTMDLRKRLRENFPGRRVISTLFSSCNVPPRCSNLPPSPRQHLERLEFTRSTLYYLGGTTGK